MDTPLHYRGRPYEDPCQTSSGERPACRCGNTPSEQEPEFRAYYRSFHHHASILCLFGIAAGVVMKLPVVWGMGLLGVVVSLYRLRRMKSKRNPT